MVTAEYQIDLLGDTGKHDSLKPSLKTCGINSVVPFAQNHLRPCEGRQETLLRELTVVFMVGRAQAESS